MATTPPPAPEGANNSYFPSSQPRKSAASTTQGGDSSGHPQSNPPNPNVSTISEARSRAGGLEDAPSKHKKKHRRKQRRRNRRQSFAAPTGSPEPNPAIDTATQDQAIEEEPRGSGTVAGSVGHNAGNPLYRLGGANLSNTSLESEALLDHRYVMLPLGSRGIFDSRWMFV